MWQLQHPLRLQIRPHNQQLPLLHNRHHCCCQLLRNFLQSPHPIHRQLGLHCWHLLQIRHRCQSFLHLYLQQLWGCRGTTVWNQCAGLLAFCRREDLADSCSWANPYRYSLPQHEPCLDQRHWFLLLLGCRKRTVFCAGLPFRLFDLHWSLSQRVHLLLRPHEKTAKQLLHLQRISWLLLHQHLSQQRLPIGLRPLQFHQHQRHLLLHRSCYCHMCLPTDKELFSA